ncbi:MAG: VOC family protein [Bacteriovoracia bacterium]
MRRSSTLFFPEGLSEDSGGIIREVCLEHGFNVAREASHGVINVALSETHRDDFRDRGLEFLDWSLLLQLKAGLQMTGDLLRERLGPRLAVLAHLPDLREEPVREQHASIRVRDLARSTAFYSWLYQLHPKEWTHRYSVFQIPGFNFVLVVADDTELHQDTLYHLGREVASKNDVIRWEAKAREFGATILKPARTTWMGTPLHELWIQDPDGIIIEIYARLSPGELEQRPADMTPVFLT